MKDEFLDWLDKILEFATIFKSPENEIKLVRQIRDRYYEYLNTNKTAI